MLLYPNELKLMPHQNLYTGDNEALLIIAKMGKKSI
jgi:hypothetical protein